MSSLNFSKWNLNERIKRTNIKSIRNTSILREQGENLGFWKSKYGTDLEPQEESLMVDDQDMMDDESEYGFQPQMDNEYLPDPPEVIIIDEPLLYGDGGERDYDRSLEGLEGPFSFKRGELYYDPKEGKYYDRGTDMYLDHDESDKWTMGESKDYLPDPPEFIIIDEPLLYGDGGERDYDRSLEGLEGPFSFKRGELYYDPKEGKYYDRGTDMYLDHDESDKWTMGESKDYLPDPPEFIIIDEPLLYGDGGERDYDRSLDGLEGPFSFKGRELYYDPKEGKYYDRRTDMYLDHDESTKWTMGESKGYLSEMPYGTDDEKESEETIIPIEDISTIAFDFARSWYDGMWDPLYRIGSSGKMYVSDIDYVESEIQSAIESDEGEDPEWSEILMMAEDEIDSLKRKYGSGLLESDDLDFDF